jgi:5'(3')-deoxyribonucleotidase
MWTVAVDCDGVLVAVNPLIVAEWQAAGLPYTYEDITAFDYEACVGREAKDLAFGVFRRPDLYDKLKPEPGALMGLRDLRKFARVIAVSNAMPEHAGSKLRFLLRTGFSHRDIFLAADKASVCANLLIDDRASTLYHWPRERIVFDRPWNRSWDIPYCHRVKEWPDIAPLVYAIKSFENGNGR